MLSRGRPSTSSANTARTRHTYEQKVTGDVEIANTVLSPSQHKGEKAGQTYQGPYQLPNQCRRAPHLATPPTTAIVLPPVLLPLSGYCGSVAATATAASAAAAGHCCRCRCRCCCLPMLYTSFGAPAFGPSLCTLRLSARSSRCAPAIPCKARITYTATAEGLQWHCRATLRLCQAAQTLVSRADSRGCCVTHVPPTTPPNFSMYYNANREWRG
jgi:hypothetical protein